MTLDDCEKLFCEVRAAKSISEAFYSLENLFNYYEVMSVELEPNAAPFWKARPAEDKPWDDMSEMSYIQNSSKVNCNRLNDPGKPLLYTAMDIDTALIEIDAGVDTYVQVAGFKAYPERPLRIVKIGEFFHVYKKGYLELTGYDPGKSIQNFLNSSDRSHSERVLFIDAFLASLLADPKAEKQDYILTRAIARLIYRDNNIDGIAYPSVQDTFGMNLALLPQSVDEKLRLVCCFHAKVNRKREFGFIKYQVLNEVEQLDDNGYPSSWVAPRSEYERRYFNLSKEECSSALKFACN